MRKWEFIFARPLNSVGGSNRLQQLKQRSSARDSKAASLAEVQANHSAGFMTTRTCMKGVVGGAYKRTMAV